MKISDVRVRIIKKDDNKLKAVASITIDECFVVHDIKVIEGNQGYFIAMPSRKTLDGEYKDIVHPLNTETREEIRAAILAEFEIAQKEANETETWLSVLYKSSIIDDLTFKSLRKKCGKIRRMLIASITTVKAKTN